MDIYTLQQRANALVDKVNIYEESLTGIELDETELLNNHTYADLYCFRPVMNLLFGADIDTKLNRNVLSYNKPILTVTSSPANQATITESSATTYTYYKTDSTDDLLTYPETAGTRPNKLDVSRPWTVQGTFFVENPQATDTIDYWVIAKIQDFYKVLQFDDNSYLSNVSIEYKVNAEGSFIILNLGRMNSDGGDLTGYTTKIQPDSSKLYVCVIEFDGTNLNVNINSTSYLSMHANVVGKKDAYIWSGTAKVRDFDAVGVDYDNSFIQGSDLEGNSILIDSLLINNREHFIKTSKTIEDSGQYPLVQSTQRNLYQNIDMMNNHNMLVMDQSGYKDLEDSEMYIKTNGLYNVSANIADALAIESQVANVFKWNTTDLEFLDIDDNTYTVPGQVPGIVCYYLGNGYEGEYTATISDNLGKLQSIYYNYPPYYGAFYRTDSADTSQVGESMGHECCRIFMLGTNYMGGRLTSPQQIWQAPIGESVNINWQGEALYHELVYKDKRSGVEFIEPQDTVPDNDPQGLVTRLCLSKQKQYYYKRPWFKELDSVTESPATVADNSNYTKAYEPNTTLIQSLDDTYYNKYTGLYTSSIKPQSEVFNNFEVTLGTSSTDMAFDVGTIQLKGTTSTQTTSSAFDVTILRLTSATTGILMNNALSTFDVGVIRTLRSTYPNVRFIIKLQKLPSGEYSIKLFSDMTGSRQLINSKVGIPASSTDTSKLIQVDGWSQLTPDEAIDLTLTNLEGTPLVEFKTIQDIKTDSDFYNNYKYTYDNYKGN